MIREMPAQKKRAAVGRLSLFRFAPAQEAGGVRHADCHVISDTQYRPVQFSWTKIVRKPDRIRSFGDF